MQSYRLKVKTLALRFLSFLMFDSIIRFLLIESFYRPFFNLLVLIYLGLQKIMTNPDMGIAVIVFTIALRMILLPVSLASEESEEEKREIGLKFDRIRKQYADNPVDFKEARDALVSTYHRRVRGEVLNVGLQVAVALMLWRIFAKGLGGADLSLLYDFIPRPKLPFNLEFMGRIDLTKPNLAMNMVSSILLFIAETLSLANSPYPATRNDRLMQFLFPFGVFVYLYNMPAGKKLFVITTLSLTIFLVVLKELHSIWYLWKKKKEAKRVVYGRVMR